jgi:hypothetical protein
VIESQQSVNAFPVDLQQSVILCPVDVKQAFTLVKQKARAQHSHIEIV